MVFKTLLTRAGPAVRNFQTSAAVRGGHHDTRGIFGSNLPFPVHNKFLLTSLFIVFFSTGLGAPFLTLRYMILAKNQ